MILISSNSQQNALPAHFHDRQNGQDMTLDEGTSAEGLEKTNVQRMYNQHSTDEEMFLLRRTHEQVRPLVAGGEQNLSPGTQRKKPALGSSGRQRKIAEQDQRFPKELDNQVYKSIDQALAGRTNLALATLLGCDAQPGRSIDWSLATAS